MSWFIPSCDSHKSHNKQAHTNRNKFTINFHKIGIYVSMPVFLSQFYIKVYKTLVLGRQNQG
jgi:hypothetical protein